MLSMSKMSKIDQIYLRAVMLCMSEMSKMSKIDQIHLRAVMLCMSKMSKMGKEHTHTFWLITSLIPNGFSIQKKSFGKLRLRAFQPYHQILCILKHVKDVKENLSNKSYGTTGGQLSQPGVTAKSSGPSYESYSRTTQDQGRSNRGICMTTWHHQP